MKTDTPLVSYVVLSWNTLQDTKKCIESIIKQEHSNKQVIVVDNGSSDGSKDYLASLENITYVDLPKNTGFTGGQITAYKYCHGEYIALINSDASLADNWTQVCLDTLNKNNKTAAVGGKAFEWNKDYLLGATDSPFYSYQKINLETGLTETYKSGETEIEVDSISGAAVMIKNSAIKDVGYFDNDFFAYYEETDLFARMIRAGYKIIYQPKAHVWHQIAKSSNGDPYFYLYQMHRNRFLFSYKNIDDIRGFTKNYFLNGLRSYKLYFKDRSNLEAKAMAKSASWNMRHFLETYKKRTKILSLGNSYSEIIKKHRPGDDVTIIIPSYNYKPYLKKAILSAVNQKHKPHKIIVIDDGSSDGSAELAKSIDTKGIDYEVVVKKNEGVVATKNLGIKMSTTAWTIFLDADDILEPNYINETLKTAAKSTSDIVYTDMMYFGAKGGLFSADEFSHHRLIEGNFIHNSALLNTTLLKRTGGYKSAMNDGYEDWELYLTLAEAGGKFAKSTSTHLNYRQHSNGLGRNNKADSDGERIRQKALVFHSSYINFINQKPSLWQRIITSVCKNPELVIMLPIIFILSALISIVNYFYFVKTNMAKIVRIYLKQRNS
ncbi:MAG: glycosyltransferase [Romboutsia sp.]|nr:glycosyltransferase [Romboutsia sp.]